ncbi:MAG TPA: malto-oligosyltrehalose trehalohydrolase [Burkholderiales bacterium]|nr:malto-oligosyltrehalose trehalohydrolase [Burkholderiales bacterium]
MKRAHAMPFGAEALPDGRTRFRLWAPSAQSVELVLADQQQAHALTPRDREGWYETTLAAPAGTCYRYRIDGKLEVPDPASRYNPDDVHGPSVVVNPRGFEWRDAAWRGRPWTETVVYELHVGTFSPDGTYAGVERKLDYLAELGVTAIELMPLADFPGKRNWGYDGALQYAPDAAYGSPEDLKRLIAAAHARGLMMFLDVVYNHFGPEGNYLHAYAADFFTERHHTAWGAAVNFDGERSRTVREFFIHNALYWLEEYHFDGLRFDAVHAILDDSNPDILSELAQRVRAGPGAQRHVHLMLENDDNHARYLEYRNGAPRLYNAQWNDDAHHAFHVLLTGEKDGYYADYADDATERLGRALAEGFAYQGERSAFRDAPRGEPSAHLPPYAFVTFLQNHDQTGNRALGERIGALTPPARLKAALTAWLLAPATPMLFMGEEFAAASPFLFFCDFGPELASAVTEGRRREFREFAQFAGLSESAVPDPNHPDTFERSKLDWLSIERAEHAEWLGLYQTLLALRRSRIVPALANLDGNAGRYAVVSPGALIAIWHLGDGSILETRLNLSADSANSQSAPEGDLLHCEPAAAAAAFGRGELPPEAAACYLKRNT